MTSLEYSEIKNNIRTGDVVLFSGKGIDSKIINYLTKSKWTHVGMAIVIPDWDMIFLWEYTPINDIADLSHNKRKIGIQLVPLEERIRNYKGDMCIRHLVGVDIESDFFMKKTLVSYKNELESNYYDRSIFNAIKFRIVFAWKGILNTILGRDTKDLGINCSHIVATAYQRMGLLPSPPKGRNPWRFTPKDFSDDELPILWKGYLTKKIYFKY